MRAPRAASAPRERPGSAWSAHSRAAALTATEVKATILALLDDVAAGDEVEITKHGRVVAQLVPAPRSAPDPRGARRYRAERSRR